MARRRLDASWATALTAVALANLVGLALLVFAGRLYQETNEFIERAWPAPGVVVGLERLDAGESADPRTSPVVRFETAKGESHRFRARMMVSWRDYTVGDSVTVLYDPDAPDEALVDDSLRLWLAPVVSAALGLILMLGATAALAVAAFPSPGGARRPASASVE
jgi:hypothetical protein